MNVFENRKVMLPKDGCKISFKLCKLISVTKFVTKYWSWEGKGAIHNSVEYTCSNCVLNSSWTQNFVVSSHLEIIRPWNARPIELWATKLHENGADYIYFEKLFILDVNKAGSVASVVMRIAISLCIFEMFHAYLRFDLFACYVFACIVFCKSKNQDQYLILTTRTNITNICIITFHPILKNCYVYLVSSSPFTPIFPVVRESWFDLWFNLPTTFQPGIVKLSSTHFS